jgi:alkylated DNA repair dioxygenase AlkB
MHSDNEAGLGSIIATISLGATRRFKIKHNATKETKEFLVSNGSLIIMAGTMQRFWKHEILKTKEIVGERISLTFRQLEV